MSVVVAKKVTLLFSRSRRLLCCYNVVIVKVDEVVVFISTPPC